MVVIFSTTILFMLSTRCTLERRRSFLESSQLLAPLPSSPLRLSMMPTPSSSSSWLSLCQCYCHTIDKSPPPETSYSERGGPENEGNLLCWDCGCWRGPTPRAHDSYEEEQRLEDIFVWIHDDNWGWQSSSTVWKCSTDPKKWKTRLKIEFGPFWMHDKDIHDMKIML